MQFSLMSIFTQQNTSLSMRQRSTVSFFASFVKLVFYTSFLSHIQNPIPWRLEISGFSSPLVQCCGSYGDHHVVHCGMKAIVNGTEVEALCSNPSKYISWDGVHYSDAANEWIANQIMDGSFSDPPVSITEACHSPPQFWFNFKQITCAISLVQI